MQAASLTSMAACIVSISRGAVAKVGPKTVVQPSPNPRDHPIFLAFLLDLSYFSTIDPVCPSSRRLSAKTSAHGSHLCCCALMLLSRRERVNSLVFLLAERRLVHTDLISGPIGDKLGSSPIGREVRSVCTSLALSQ